MTEFKVANFTTIEKPRIKTGGFFFQIFFFSSQRPRGSNEINTSEAFKCTSKFFFPFIYICHVLEVNHVLYKPVRAEIQRVFLAQGNRNYRLSVGGLVPKIVWGSGVLR